MKLVLNVNNNDEIVKVPSQQVVGSLMYAMLCTWLKLAYPISVVSQHMANLSLVLEILFVSNSQC